jgi:hypothetical protein
MRSTRTIKIHNVEKIVGSDIRHRSPTPVHWDLKSVVTKVEETEHLYTFTINTEYNDMIGVHEIVLVRHGGIWDSMPHTPIYTLRDGRGEKLEVFGSDIRDKKTLLKRMGQLMEIGV